MIAACASRFDRDCPPLTWQITAGHGGFLLLDGVSSWGSGAEAAAWTRVRLAHVFELRPPTSPHALADELMSTLRNLPDSITADDWGWSFSVAAAVIYGGTIQVASLGRHAIIALKQGQSITLAAPIRLVDDLVALGRVSPADAERHPLNRIMKGPFLGDAGATLDWNPPVALDGFDAVVAGDAALPRLLALRNMTLCSDPVQVRDAVENCGGRSSSTAIILRGGHGE